LPGGALLRGETLAATGTAPLQDRATATRRHPGAKTVLALPAANVGLVGPLHERLKDEKERRMDARGASIDERLGVASASLVHRQLCPSGERQAALLSQTGSLRVVRSDTNPQVWICMWGT